MNLVEDVRERTDLKARNPEMFERLRTSFDRWNAKMLPYPDGSFSHDPKEGYSDRY